MKKNLEDRTRKENSEEEKKKVRGQEARGAE
jgi:hypothetical protein